MSKTKQFIPRSVILAVIIHAVVLILLALGYQLAPESNQVSADPINIVKAEVIDGDAIEEEKQRIKQIEQERLRKQREEQLRKQREKEEQRKKELEAKKRAEEKRQAEIKQAQEQKKQAEEARKQAELAKQQAELEKKKAEEARKKAEEERLKAEENARKLEEELKKQELAKKQAEIEAEQKRLEAILEQEEADIRAAEEQVKRLARQRELNALKLQYSNALQSKIQSRWRKPPNVENKNISCKVYVKQLPGGIIEEVQVRDCRGGDEQFRRSVEEAVWKSDPLPMPSDDELFSRELKITFRPR